MDRAIKRPCLAEGVLKRPASACTPSPQTSGGPGDSSDSDDEGDLDVEAKAAMYGWHFDMLHHRERNAKFADAIRRTLQLAHDDQRSEHAPRCKRVLDIGTGSGLLAQLSLEAASRLGIGCLVTAIEADPTLAALAHQNINTYLGALQSPMDAERQLCECNAVVLPAKSVALSRSDLPFGAQLADVMVAEILDSGLIGEDCLPTMRHAAENLLRSGYRSVPSAAKVWAQLVEGSIFQHWDTIVESDLDLNMDVSLCGAGDAHPFDCDVGLLIRNGVVTPLSEPFFAFEFNFCDPSTFPSAGRSRICSAGPQGGAIHALRNGTVHAVVFWWDCILSPGVVLSTRPTFLQEDGAGENKDANLHWQQAVSVLPPSSVWQVTAGEEIKLCANHNDEDIWFSCGSPSIPCRRGNGVLRRRPASSSGSQRDVAVQSIGTWSPAPPMPRAAESDPWHGTCDSTRFWHLNSSFCGAKLLNVMQSALIDARTVQGIASSVSSPIFCLDISDGSLMTLAAAQLSCSSPDAAPGVFVSLERSKAAARLWRKVLKNARVKLSSKADMYCAHGTIPSWLMKLLWSRRRGKLNTGEQQQEEEGEIHEEEEEEEQEEVDDEEEGEEEEGQEEEEEEEQDNNNKEEKDKEGYHEGKLQGNCAEQPIFQLVVAEPTYFDVTHHVWGEASLLFLWSQLSDLVSARLASFHDPLKTLASPCLGRVMAMAISCPNLWKLQQPITVESLGLQPGSRVNINAINELTPALDDTLGAERPCLSVAMWKHAYQPLSDSFLLLEVDLTQRVQPLSSKMEVPISAPSASAASEPATVHALVLWVDFVMLRANADHEEIILSTAAPMQQSKDGVKHEYERFANCFLQGVRFASLPQSLHAGPNFLHVSTSFAPDKSGENITVGFRVGHESERSQVS